MLNWRQEKRQTHRNWFSSTSLKQECHSLVVPRISQDRLPCGITRLPDSQHCCHCEAFRTQISLDTCGYVYIFGCPDIRIFQVKSELSHPQQVRRFLEVDASAQVSHVRQESVKEKLHWCCQNVREHFTRPVFPTGTPYNPIHQRPGESPLNCFAPCISAWFQSCLYKRGVNMC